jgi:hypothetical protein
MPRTYTLSNTISENDLVEFDLFTNLNSEMTDTKIPLTDLEASTGVISFILKQKSWSPFVYTVNSLPVIGYGFSNGNDSNGLTESEAYSFFIEDLKNKERAFKKIVPLSLISQTNYDALFSLFYFTSDISKTGTPDRQFKINNYIVNEQWQWVATALVLSGNQRIVRQGEAKIMMLADYGSVKSRSLLKAQGLQNIRTLYPNGFETTKSLNQAEYVYYKETNRFLPKMTQSRKRQIVNLANLST